MEEWIEHWRYKMRKGSGSPPKVGTGEVLEAKIVDMSTCVKMSDWGSHVGYNT